MAGAMLATPVLVGLVGVALLFDFLNGLHDSANSIATVVSTGVLKPTTAVVFASPPTATRLRRARVFAQNQELEELSRGFQAARDTARAKLLGQVSDAHAAGVVGVEFAHSVERDKFALASSLTGSGQRGWRRGRLGIPYRVSGHSDVERRGWVITMHAAGTAIRPLAASAEPSTVKPSLYL